MTGSLHSRCRARLVGQYNAQRRELRKALADAVAWEKFARFCESSQRELDDWKKKPWVDDPKEKGPWLTANAHISFADPGRRAGWVVDHAEFWNNVKVLCGTSENRFPLKNAGPGRISYKTRLGR